MAGLPSPEERTMAVALRGTQAADTDEIEGASWRTSFANRDVRGRRNLIPNSRGFARVLSSFQNHR